MCSASLPLIWCSTGGGTYSTGGDCPVEYRGRDVANATAGEERIGHWYLPCDASRHQQARYVRHLLQPEVQPLRPPVPRPLQERTRERYGLLCDAATLHPPKPDEGRNREQGRRLRLEQLEGTFRLSESRGNLLTLPSGRKVSEANILAKCQTQPASVPPTPL